MNEVGWLDKMYLEEGIQGLFIEFTRNDYTW